MNRVVKRYNTDRLRRGAFQRLENREAMGFYEGGHRLESRWAIDHHVFIKL